VPYHVLLLEWKSRISAFRVTKQRIFAVFQFICKYNVGELYRPCFSEELALNGEIPANTELKLSA
jgi:hypothetical protein